MVVDNLETCAPSCRIFIFFPLRLIKKGLGFYSDELAAVQCRHLREAGRDMIHVLKFFSSDALRLSSTGFGVVCFSFFFFFIS